MVVARGDTQAVLFPVVLTPLEWGPLRFAATWGWVSVRTGTDHTFGFADPKAFARLRVAGADSAASWGLWAEGAARAPVADAKLHPFAHGGQELELMGTLGVPGWLGLHAGAGRIWAEPPARSRLRRSDVPHATHAWALLQRRLGRWALTARHDELWMAGGHRRTQLEAAVGFLPVHGLRVTAGALFEVGPQRERVQDRAASLRFAVPLR